MEPLTDTVEDTSQDTIETMMLTSEENNNTLDKLNNKLLEKKDHRSTLATYLMSPLSKITNPEITSQFNLVKDLNSNRVNDLLIDKTTPVTLYNNLLTFRDTDRKFELQGDLLKMITNESYNVDIANSQDRISRYEFANETYFDGKAFGNKSTRDRSPIRLLKSPSRMVSASVVSSSHKKKPFSKTKILSSDPIEVCDSLKFFSKKNKLGRILI